MPEAHGRARSQRPAVWSRGSGPGGNPGAQHSSGITPAYQGARAELTAQHRALEQERTPLSRVGSVITRHPRRLHSHPAPPFLQVTADSNLVHILRAQNGKDTEEGGRVGRLRKNPQLLGVPSEEDSPHQQGKGQVVANYCLVATSSVQATWPDATPDLPRKNISQDVKDGYQPGPWGQAALSPNPALLLTSQETIKLPHLWESQGPHMQIKSRERPRVG